MLSPAALVKVSPWQSVDDLLTDADWICDNSPAATCVRR